MNHVFHIFFMAFFLFFHGQEGNHFPSRRRGFHFLFSFFQVIPVRLLQELMSTSYLVYRAVRYGAMTAVPASTPNHTKNGIKQEMNSPTGVEGNTEARKHVPPVSIPLNLRALMQQVVVVPGARGVHAHLRQGSQPARHNAADPGCLRPFFYAVLRVGEGGMTDLAAALRELPPWAAIKTLLQYVLR